MTGAYPQTLREHRDFARCQALPIAGARLRIGGLDKTIAVRPGDKAAVFEIELPGGDTEMKTWFLDAAGKELCGAYYVDVELL